MFDLCQSSKPPFVVMAITGHDLDRPEHEPFITLRRKSIEGNLPVLELQACARLNRICTAKMGMPSEITLFQLNKESSQIGLSTMTPVLFTTSSSYLKRWLVYSMVFFTTREPRGI